MRRISAYLAFSLLLLGVQASTRAQDILVPAGTLLHCTLDEPNFSSATADVGDPVVCHLNSLRQFGIEVFPRGSYLGGHLEADKDPGHFVGKGYLELEFDRIGFPSSDIPVPSKVIAAKGYKVDRHGDIVGKGHATRDVVEWMIPPLWPWKIITLPARGPRPTLKGESQLELRLMDDVLIPQVSATNGPDWHFFGRPRMENDAYYQGSYQQGSYQGSYQGTSSRSQDNYGSVPQLSVRRVSVTASEQTSNPEIPQVQVAYASYVTKGSANGGTAPGVPVFILKTGMVLEVGNYTYQDGRITYELASGGSGVISTDEVDWTTTTQVNSQRGVRMTLRGGHPNSGTAGF